MVITFSNIRGSGGGGGATGGTVSGITLWSDETTKAYIDNALSGVTDVLSAYTPTSGFSTINGSAITEGGNLVIEATPYTAGTNIDITDHIISVTGITIPTKVSELVNDSGYITTADTQNFVTSGDVKTQIESYNYINSGQAQTQIDNSISGKMDTSAMTAYATTGWVENQGYLTTETDPIFTGSPAYGITAQDIANWNAATGGSAYSAGQYINIDVNNEISVTGITSYTGITSGDVVTALGYTPISGVDLSDYYTSAQTDTAISNAVSGKADSSRVDEIEEVTASALTDLNNRMITTGTVESMITAATSGKQDTLVSGTNIKTINNESILGSGNITIQGGGCGSNIIELTQAEYDALTAYTEDAIYVITDAPVYDISNYELLSNKVTSISSASTDTQYPSAKCVYDLIGDVETLLANI